MIIISVVRNFDMYNKFVKESKFNIDMDFVAFNNNDENQTITKRYNSFLNSYDYSKEAWFIFCHEDWEIQEYWQSKFKQLNKNYLYGPIGCQLNYVLHSDATIGEIVNSNKDGSEASFAGKFCSHLAEVGTFDCQCLIVHSSLINKYDLRFDESLHFDLYVEDFCINARENYNIKSYILQLKCKHFSYGEKNQRFLKQFEYLQNKHKLAKNFYWTTCSKHSIGRKFSLKEHAIKIIKYTQRFIYRSYIDGNGRKIIKICKIPIYSKQIKNINNIGNNNA